MGKDFSKSSGAMGLSNLIKKSEENIDTKVIYKIKLEDIEHNPKNSEIFNLSDIEYLANGIKEEGFHGAIEVFQKADGKYEISSGHRRYEAMKYLKEETIPCIVSQELSETAKARKLLSSNYRTRKLTPLEIARSIKEFREILKKEGYGKKNVIEEIENFFNLKSSSIQRYESIMKMIPELQEMANNPAFPYSAFVTAAALDKELQYVLYNRLIKYKSQQPDAELTRTRIEQFINEIKEGVQLKKRREEKKEQREEQFEDDSINKIDVNFYEEFKNEDKVSGNYFEKEDFKEISIEHKQETEEISDREIELLKKLEDINSYIFDNSKYLNKDLLIKKIDNLRSSILAL